MSLYADYRADDVLNAVLVSRGWTAARSGEIGPWTPGDPDAWYLQSPESAVLLRLTTHQHEFTYFDGDHISVEPQLAFVSHALLQQHLEELESYVTSNPGAIPHEVLPPVDLNRARIHLRLASETPRYVPPYDEVLDTYLRSRGWWSYRSWKGDGDLAFDQWSWGPDHDKPGLHLSITCHGNNLYEMQIPKRFDPSYDQSHYVIETVEGRAAILGKIAGLERLVPNRQPVY